MTNLEILLDLYKRYTKKHLVKIFLSIFFSILVAGSTAMIAYLLDPAIEKIFIEKNQKLMVIIPFVILVAFAVKGTSLYLIVIIWAMKCYVFEVVRGTVVWSDLVDERPPRCADCVSGRGIPELARCVR